MSSTEFGAPVDVIISSESQTNGETIINIPLGAVFKFLRDTSEWSKEDYVGPVLVVKPKNSNDHLDIQLFNRRSVNNIKLQFYKNSGYHRNENIIMMRARDGTVYGLASNNDYSEQLNQLEKKLKEFTTTPTNVVCESPPLRSYSPLSQNNITDNDSPIGDCISSSLATSFSTPPAAKNNGHFTPQSIVKPNIVSQSPFSNAPIYSNFYKPEESSTPNKWNTKPQMIPASVLRRAAAPKNGFSRPASVTPFSAAKEDKITAIINSVRQQNLNDLPPIVVKQNNAPQLDRYSFNPKNNHTHSAAAAQSLLLSKATAPEVAPKDRMEAVMELISFAYKDGLKKGAEDPKHGLLAMPNDQLLNVLEDVLNKKPEVKKRLLEKLNQ